MKKTNITSKNAQKVGYSLGKEFYAKIIKEIKIYNKKNKENQKFNFIWVISQLFVKIESIYFNYWSETLAIRK